jgi:uncharacterized membrane protein
MTFTCLDAATLTKGVAALSSFVPLSMVWLQIQDYLSEPQRRLITHPFSMTLLAYGGAYTACNNVNVAVFAVVLATSFATMYDDLIADDE